MGVPLWRPRSPSPCEKSVKKSRIDYSDSRRQEQPDSNQEPRNSNNRGRIGFLTTLRRRNALYRRGERSRSIGSNTRPQVHFTNPIADTMEPPIDIEEPNIDYNYYVERTRQRERNTNNNIYRNLASRSTLYDENDTFSFREFLNSIRTHHEEDLPPDQSRAYRQLLRRENNNNSSNNNNNNNNNSNNSSNNHDSSSTTDDENCTN